MRGAVLVLAACGGAPADIDAPPACACPTAMPAPHSGLQPIDACAFPLAHAANTFALPALPVVPIDQLDFNRTLTRLDPAQLPGTAPGVSRVYQWESGDETVAYWIPQGITGSWDAGRAGKRIALVSWYYKQALDPGSTVDKGVRLAVIDVDAATYRFALLVEPTATGYQAVTVHAGGLAWVGDKLYVPVTASGFRVFDLAHILQVDGTADSLGNDGTHDNAYQYLYMIPQIGTYTSTGACAPVFSFAAVAGDSILSGEYDATSANGRLYQWHLDASPTPVAAYAMAESYIQGAAQVGDSYFLSSSRPAAGHGELVRTAVATPSTTLGWSDSPEDLSYDPQTDGLWSLSEGASARYVFEVAVDALR